MLGQERLRYVEKILFPLAQLSSLSIESDLKWMAIYSAFHWRHYKKELVSTAVKFFEDYLLNFSNKLWTSDKKCMFSLTVIFSFIRLLRIRWL